MFQEVMTQWKVGLRIAGLDLYFMPSLLSKFTHFHFPSSTISLSYFIFAVIMPWCWEQHSCMSFSVSINTELHLLFFSVITMKIFSSRMLFSYCSPFTYWFNDLLSSWTSWCVWIFHFYLSGVWTLQEWRTIWLPHLCCHIIWEENEVWQVFRHSPVSPLCNI